MLSIDQESQLYKELVVKHNNALRATFSPVYGQVMVTPKVNFLDHINRERVFNLIKNYDNWNDGNDIHGEHNFGQVNYDGLLYYWKIDYFDKTMVKRSTDPSNNVITNRVLSIMRSDEY